jgi:toxin ParE1/3/4
MSSRYIIRQSAQDDLKKIYRYGFERFGLQKTESYVDSLVIRFQYLADNNNLGQDCSFLVPGVRMYRISSHCIYYRPVSDGIDILRILHKSMLAELNLK